LLYRIQCRIEFFDQEGTGVSSILYRIGRASFRMRGHVLIAWALVLAVLGALTLGFAGKFDDTFEIPGAESTVALAKLKATFPEAADSTATVLITVGGDEKLKDADVKDAVEAWLKRLEALPYVNGTIGPYSDVVEGLISADGRSGRVSVRVKQTVSTFTDAQRADLTAQARTLETDLPGSRVLVGGDVFSVNVPHITVTEAAGVGVALIVLLLTLGSFVAAMMPIGTAIAGVGMAVLIVELAAGVITISSTTLILAVMLGLAVGIDYALFIISRHRDQLAAGMDVEESAARAVGTAGSAVVFAGLTVVIALIGLSLANVPFLTVMGAFGAVGVALEVALALTLLPAFMGFAGERLRPKPRTARKTDKAAAVSSPDKSGTRGTPTSSAGSGVPPKKGIFSTSFRPAELWVKAVTKWPIVTIVIVLAGLGALAYPTKDLYLALPTAGRSAPDSQNRETADEISRIFGPGFNGPLVVTVDIVESDDPVKILDAIRDDIQAMPGVKLVAAATPNANVDTGMVQIIPMTAPDDPATAELVHQLRAREPDWEQLWHVDTAITGLTAVQIDVTERLQNALLPFGIFVVGLSIVLLTMVFRSIWVPIKAALGYLLSVGAAFGATVLVFNKGWFAAVVNLAEPGPVISFLPIIMMGLLFGLAMDYEVFLVSRMREEYVHGNTENSVTDGFVHSAKVVVAAGLIMTSVFAFFVPQGDGPIKAIAFALAVGVALDAFVVRMTLVPAVMKLLGHHAWWLPKWLDARLPSLDIEGESLTRQLALADWPAPGDASAVVADGLVAVLGDRRLFDGVSLQLARGQVLLIEGEPAQRRALLYALAGRLKLDGGRLKVLGLVLPEEAPLLRRQAPVLGPSTPHFGRLLKGRDDGIVFVEAADELSNTQEHSLRRALDAGGPVTWVLTAAPGSGLASQLGRECAELRLPSHVALEGANR
jgi:RND superfamily putative drug exporter